MARLEPRAILSIQLSVLLEHHRHQDHEPYHGDLVAVAESLLAMGVTVPEGDDN